MKRIFGGLFYALGGLGLLSSLLGLSEMFSRESGGDLHLAGMLAETLGLFFIPVLFLWIGYALRKDDAQS